MLNNTLRVYDENKCRFFALGRNAMYAACLALGLKEGDEVLTPAFDCDGSLQPFKVLNLKLRFYRSNPNDFSVDIDDIRRKISAKTKLLHVINHFGFPQPWDEILALRKDTGIPILEDNAYSLFSSFNGKPFGSFGDMSIFSLRKNLPLIDGGMLRVNNPKYNLPDINTNAPLFYRTEAMTLLTLIKTKLGWHKAPGFLRSIARRFHPEIEPPVPLYSDKEKGYPDWPLRDHIGEEFACNYLRPISRLARMQLNRFSKKYYDNVCSKKREAYARLSVNLGGIKGITVLCPALPEGIIPFSLSMLVDSGRDGLFKKLREKYDVMAWPILPKDVLDDLGDYPEVELLGRKLLQINLVSDKVMLPSFSRYLDGLIEEICRMENA